MKFQRLGLWMVAVGLGISVAGCGGSRTETDGGRAASNPTLAESGPLATVVAKKPLLPGKDLRPAAAALGVLDWDRGPFAFPSIHDWTLKETAADALSRLGEPAVPALAQALQAADVSVRLNAARALARIGPEGKLAVPALIQALQDADPLVRVTAARALGQIGSPGANEAIPHLIRALGPEPPAKLP